MALAEGVHTKEGHQLHAKSVVSVVVDFHRTLVLRQQACVSVLCIVYNTSV